MSCQVTLQVLHGLSKSTQMHIAANEHDVVYALQVRSSVGVDVLPVHYRDV